MNNSGMTDIPMTKSEFRPTNNHKIEAAEKRLRGNTPKPEEAV
jgi:hypothetical protein